MDRRTYLALLGTVGAGTAGCLSDGSGSSTEPPSTARSPPGGRSASPATTDPPLDVTTPEPGECEAEPAPYPSTSEGLPDPRAYPERPTGIEVAPVRTFVEEYEAAYRYNRELARVASTGNCLEYLDASSTESTVVSVENGVAGEVVTRASFTGRTCPGTTGTDTRTPLPHADLAAESARYYVTDRFLLRNGVVLECWD